MEETDQMTDAESASIPLDELVGYNLRRAAALTLNDFALEFADVPLRPATFGMLALIDETPGISAAELGRALGIKRANMAPLVLELEESGWLQRSNHSNDKRMQILFLTAEAKSAMPQWRQRAVRHEDRVFMNLTKRERATLLRLLRRVWIDDAASD